MSMRPSPLPQRAQPAVYAHFREEGSSFRALPFATVALICPCHLSPSFSALLGLLGLQFCLPFDETPSLIHVHPVPLSGFQLDEIPPKVDLRFRKVSARILFSQYTLLVLMRTFSTLFVEL